MNQTPRIFVATGNAAPSPNPLAIKGAATSKPALILDHVRQVYDTVEAVDDVSFSLSHGELLALVRHSGSGKSTVLRVAAGLERPESGRVILDNREVCNDRIFVPAERRGVGLMFQDYAPVSYTHLTLPTTPN